MVPRQDNEQGSPTEEEDVMKKIGEYTIKGSVLAEDSATVPKRITLFDGRFDTGYRVTKFEIATKGNKTEDVQGVLATVDGLTPVEDWNFGDQRELAMGYGTSGITTISPFNHLSTLITWLSRICICIPRTLTGSTTSSRLRSMISPTGRVL